MNTVSLYIGINYITTRVYMHWSFDKIKLNLKQKIMVGIFFHFN